MSGIITDKIFEQIMAIRRSGKVNMFETNTVQYLANEEEFYELVILIEENKRAYLDFILTGER